MWLRGFEVGFDRRNVGAVGGRTVRQARTTRPPHYNYALGSTGYSCDFYWWNAFHHLHNGIFR